jgi:hypothetical protein
MEIPLSMTGELQPCYVFYIRLVDCYKRETFSNLLCNDQYEDFQECKLNKRAVKILFLIIK